MMPVEQVPGLWDYVSQGLETFDKTRRANRAEETAKSQANAGLMAQLFQAGAVDAATLQGAVNAAGVKDATIMPSKAEKRKKILDQGQEAVDALTDEQRADLGF